MKDLSICIVSYNNSQLVLSLLDDIFTYTSDIDFQVYVVDNNSTDNTVSSIRSRFNHVTVIENPTNEGFGKAHNDVLDIIDSRYHAVINPDIVIHNDIFKVLINYMDRHDDVVLVTPKILNTDGTEQFLPKKIPSFYYMLGRFARFGKFFQRIRAEYSRSDENICDCTEIEFCTGCFMLMKTDAFKAVKGFDEDYFMYLEDADLSCRLRKLGKLIFYPMAHVIHSWERTSAKSVKFLLIHLKSLFIFRKKLKKMHLQ